MELETKTFPLSPFVADVVKTIDPWFARPAA
jgi:hypothetical protein